MLSACCQWDNACHSKIGQEKCILSRQTTRGSEPAASQTTLVASEPEPEQSNTDQDSDSDDSGGVSTGTHLVVVLAALAVVAAVVGAVVWMSRRQNKHHTIDQKAVYSNPLYGQAPHTPAPVANVGVYSEIDAETEGGAAPLGSLPQDSSC